MLKHRFYIVLYFLLSAYIADAQYFLTGQDPASLRWRQIRTKDFRVIFAQDDTVQANRLANLLQSTYNPVRFELQSPVVKTDVVLHNRSVISNAMVGWAPRRMDFYHTPPPDGYAQDWFKQLSLHELRHVAQLSAMHKGFGNVVRYAFGQQGTAGLFGLFVPFWFVEGDAVAIETAMSFSGRGRSPLFEAGLRAQLLEKGYYLYDKAYFGSYKDYTPDVYELGYFVVGHNRYKFGPAVWDIPLDHVARKPYTLVPFTRGIRKAIGLGKAGLYNETMYDLFEIWKKQADDTDYTPTLYLSPENKTYTSYNSPQNQSDGTVIALRVSKSDIPRIVRVSGSHEQVLYTPSMMLEQTITATDSLVVWAEYRTDPRWSNCDYSVLMVGNLNDGTQRQMTWNSRFFSPSLTCGGLRVVAVEPDLNGKSSLVVLEIENGKELFRFTSDTLTFQTPVCLPESSSIATIAVGDHGKTLMVIDLVTSAIKYKLTFGYDDISISDVNPDEVLITSGRSGISNVFRLKLATDELIQITSSRFGAADAVFGNYGDVLFSDYTSDGYRISKMDLRDAVKKPYAEVVNSNYQLGDLLGSLSLFRIDTLTAPDSSYKHEKYRKGLNLFNFHSWAPLSGSFDNLNINPGLSLMSQNTLSTAVTTFQYTYNSNEQTSRYALGFEYYGWYPAITVNASNEFRRGVAQKDDQLVPIKWHENVLTTGVYIPLQFHSGPWLKGLLPSISYQLTDRRMVKDVPLRFADPVTHALAYNIGAYSLHRKSERDLLPRLGIRAQSIFRHTVSGKSRQFYSSLNVYLPGLMAHHGMSIMAAFEEQNPTNVFFGQYISFPRGYSDLFFLKNTVVKLDYVAPLWYPDWVIPTVFYLKRIRGGLFADAFTGSNKNASNYYAAAGAEFLTDWHFLNFPFPVTIGGRISYRETDGAWVSEFLFGIDTSALY